MKDVNIIVLGSSVTSLAVVRSAAINNYDVYLIDKAPGIAFKSKFINQMNSCLIDVITIETLIDASRHHKKNYIIATSDLWIKILIEIRHLLDKLNINVLHPDNDILELCLNKGMFYSWCNNNNVPCPMHHVINRNSNIDIHVEYPMLARVAEKSERFQHLKLPKVIGIQNDKDLHNLLTLCQNENLEFVLSESLLGQELIQYSVPIARKFGKFTSCVIEKVRPFPEQCAVGSLVRLQPNEEIERLALSIMDKLNYYGIAEVEILLCKSNLQPYVIEINARPWTQYSLATKSGHNFLKFLIESHAYDELQETKYGMSWIALATDLHYCFSKSVGLVPHNKLSVLEFLISLLNVRASAVFSIRDLGPVLKKN